MTTEQIVAAAQSEQNERKEGINAFVAIACVVIVACAYVVIDIIIQAAAVIK